MIGPSSPVAIAQGAEFRGHLLHVVLACLWKL
jgi:hypothetical protein